MPRRESKVSRAEEEEEEEMDSDGESMLDNEAFEDRRGIQQLSDDEGGVLFRPRAGENDEDNYDNDTDEEDDDDDSESGDEREVSQAQTKREEKISVKAWLVRKQTYTPLVTLIPDLIKFLAGDFDPLDDEEEHGIPLWRRFMESCEEGECHRFVGCCMAAAHAFIDRKYKAIGFKQPTGQQSGGGSKGKKATKRVRDSDWPTDLGKRFAAFLCHKDTEFVFENVPVRNSFYEKYSKYGKRSFQKIPEKTNGSGSDDDDGGGGEGGGSSSSSSKKKKKSSRRDDVADASDPDPFTHTKSRAVYAYGVAQKGKAPKPLKPDEVLTNQLFKRQCKVLWRQLLKSNEELVHKMVNRELYKRKKAAEDDGGGGSDDEDAQSDEEYAPHKRASGMNVESTLDETSIKQGEKLRRKVSAREIARLEDSAYQKLGLQLLQRWLYTAKEESERHAAEKAEEEAIERRRTATLMIRKKKLAQIAVPKKLLEKIQAGAAQHKPRRFDFSRGKQKLNRAKHHSAAKNSLQMATQLTHGQHNGFIHSFANVSDHQFRPGGDVYECRRALLRLGYVHKANFTDEDGVFDEAKYEEGKAFAARMRQRSKELKEAIFDKSEAAQFRQRKPLVAKARQCLEALKPPQPNDREAKNIWRSVGKLLKRIDRTSLLEPWIQWSCRDGFGLDNNDGRSTGRGGRLSEPGHGKSGELTQTRGLSRSRAGSASLTGAAPTSSASTVGGGGSSSRRGRSRGKGGPAVDSNGGGSSSSSADASVRRFRFICSTYWHSFKPIGCDIHNNLDSKYRYNLMKIIRKSGIDFEEMFAYGYRAEFKRKLKLKEELGSEEELEEDPEFVDDPEQMEEDIDEGRAWLSNRAFIRTLKDSGVQVPTATRHQLLHCLDPNGDGRVTMDEFVRFVKDKAMRTVRCVWDEVCPVCGMRPAFRTIFHRDERTGKLIRDENGAAKPFKTELAQHQQMRRQKTWRPAHEKRRLPPPVEDDTEEAGEKEDDGYDDYADDMSEMSGAAAGATRKKKIPYLPRCPKKCQAKDWSLSNAEDALQQLLELSAVDLEAMRVKTVLAEITVPAAPKVWQDLRPYERWQRRFRAETNAGDQTAVKRLFEDFSRLTRKLWVCYSPGAADDFVEFYTVEVFYGGDWFLLKTDPEHSQASPKKKKSTRGSRGASPRSDGYSDDDMVSEDDYGSSGGDDDGNGNGNGNEDEEVSYGLSTDDEYDDDFDLEDPDEYADEEDREEWQRQRQNQLRKIRRRKQRQNPQDEPVRKFCWEALPADGPNKTRRDAAAAAAAGKKSKEAKRALRLLSPNTTYKIRVRAYNMHGASPFTQLFLTTAPERPRAPKFKGCTASSITYSWADKSTLEMQALRGLFQQLDVDGNGLISRAELLDGIRSSHTLEEFLSGVQLSARAMRKLLSLEAQAEREQEGKTRGADSSSSRNSALELLRLSSEENSDPITWPFFKSLLGSAALGDGSVADSKASAAQSFDTQTRYRLDQRVATGGPPGNNNAGEEWVSCHGEGDASSTVNSRFTVKGLAQGTRCMFRLVVINRCGVESPPSDVVIGCTKLKAPEPPRVPEGNSVSHSAIRLSLPKMSSIGADSAAARAHSNQQRILKWQSTQANVRTAQEKLQIVHGINLGFIFERYDEDGSGSISPSELRSMLKDLGAPADPESVERAIVELDEDNSGDISFDEFIRWWLKSDKPRYIVLMSKGLPQSASLRDMGGRVGVFDTHMTGSFKPSSRVQEAAAAASPTRHSRQLSSGSHLSGTESLAALMGRGWVEVYRGSNPSPIIKGLIPNTAYQFKLQLASPSSVSLLSRPIEVHTAPERVMDPGPVIIGIGPRWIKVKWYAEASGAARWQIEGKVVARSKNSRRSSTSRAGSRAGTPRKLNTSAARRGSVGADADSSQGGAAVGSTAGWKVIAETRGVDSTALVHLKNMAGSGSCLKVRVVGLNSLGVRSAPSAVRTVDMALANDEDQAEATPENAESLFVVDCTGDVVVGDTILFTEKIFVEQNQKRGPRPSRETKRSGGNATTRQFAGSRTVAAMVLAEDWVLQRHSEASSDGEGSTKVSLRSTTGSKKKKRVSRTLVLHVIWCTVQQRELAKSHGIAPAKRIKRSESSLYQFETLRRTWVDETLRVGLRAEFKLRRESESAFEEKLRRHQRQRARSLSLRNGTGKGGGGDGDDFEEWKVSME